MEGPIIYAYPRVQALADGVLVDVTQQARRTGFIVPVAMTAACWTKCVEIPPGVPGQDLGIRLSDLLELLRLSRNRLENRGKPQMNFKVRVRTAVDRIETVELKAVFGPGDAGERVVTIMLPGED
jgi:hypothetical protein